MLLEAQLPVMPGLARLLLLILQLLRDGKMVSTNLDYAIIGHVMNTVPIRWEKDGLPDAS